MGKRTKTFIAYNTAFLSKTEVFSKSYWIQKFMSKFMLSGKKFLVEKYIYPAFFKLKMYFRAQPWKLFFNQLEKFKPVLSYVNKRMGRKFNAVPIPIKDRRQLVLSLTYLTKYIKTIVNRDLDGRIFTGLHELFTTKRNPLTRKISDNIKHIADARIYMHLRWI